MRVAICSEETHYLQQRTCVNCLQRTTQAHTQHKLVYQWPLSRDPCSPLITWKTNATTNMGQHLIFGLQQATTPMKSDINNIPQPNAYTILEENRKAMSLISAACSPVDTFAPPCNMVAGGSYARYSCASHHCPRQVLLQAPRMKEPRQGLPVQLQQRKNKPRSTWLIRVLRSRACPLPGGTSLWTQLGKPAATTSPANRRNVAVTHIVETKDTPDTVTGVGRNFAELGRAPTSCC